MTITEKLEKWTERRRETVANLPLQQQAGAAQVLDALTDYLLEVEEAEKKMMEEDKNTGWFKIGRAAEITGWSVPTLRRWGLNGKIKIDQPGGKGTHVVYRVIKDAIIDANGKPIPKHKW